MSLTTHDPYSRRSGFHLIDHGFESLRMVHGQVGQHLAVKPDAFLVHPAHKIGVGQPMLTHAGVDTLDPQAPEIAFFPSAVAVGILHSDRKSVV